MRGRYPLERTFDPIQLGFANSPTSKRTSNDGLIAYRAHSGLDPKSIWGTGYFSLEKPVSVVDAELRFNIVDWGNLIRFVTTFRLLPGVSYLEGAVLHDLPKGQRDRPGQRAIWTNSLSRPGTQIYVPPPLEGKLKIETFPELLKQDAFVIHRDESKSLPS